MSDEENQKMPIPEDGAEQKIKEAYIRKNFGEFLAQDLLEAAKSGKMPEVLREFVSGKLSVQIKKKSGGVDILDYIKMFSSNHYERINTGRDIVRQSFLRAAEMGNIDFLKAFAKSKYRTGAFECLIKDSNDIGAFSANVIGKTIMKGNSAALEVLLENKPLYENAIQQDGSGFFVSGSSRLLDIMSIYAEVHPQEVARLLQCTEVKEFVEKAFDEGKYEGKILKDFSQKLQQSQSPEITLPIAEKKVTK